ncbi:MAG: SDR family NAD(P)-dependent oxidoreductase [Acidimicrobiales bacterium]
MTTSDRVALVTGAARGIGAAAAGRLAEGGAFVVAVCDVDAEAAASTARSLGGRAAGFEVDVSSSASIARCVEAVGSRLGPVGVLVNNAGIDKIEPFMDSTEETWDRLWAVNLRGVVACCKAVLEAHMIPAHHGRIVNIGSDAGRVGSSGEAVYSATKGGVIAFTKTLAREMARDGVTVNCVCPGPTDTALLAQVGEASPELLSGLAKAIPLRRIAQPADIAAAVAFLASEDAGYITGQTLSVSGGLTMS